MTVILKLNSDLALKKAIGREAKTIKGSNISCAASSILDSK